MTGNNQPQVIEREPFSVIGLVYQGPMGNHEGLADLWHGWERRSGEIQPKAAENLAFGVFYSSPAQVQQGEFTYLAGSPVTIAAEVPEGMERIAVPGGSFASLTHKGPMEDLAATYQALFQWIDDSGRAVDDRPGYELYDGRFNPVSPDNEIDLFISVKTG